MLPNLRFAVRSLMRSPGYALAFVLTLGLGIGLNTAIFSVVNGVLLAPLPYNDADRIMYVRQPALQAGVENVSFSFQEVQDYRDRSRTLDELVEYGDWTFNVVPDEGDPHRAVGGLVTSNYFGVLGLTPGLGRVLGPQDDGDSAEPVAVLTHDYWVRAFGSDPDVLGRTLKLYAFSSPRSTRVVGVLDPGTHYTGSRRQDFFVNYATNDHYLGATMQDDRTHRMTDVFARLAPGRTPLEAQQELAAINRTLHAQYPDAYPDRRGLSIAASMWQEELTKAARPVFLILMGTVALVLLLACANVANLTLTRLAQRERELSIRAALGAGRRTLRAQLLTENLVLSLAGAGLGLVLAVFGLDLLVQYANRFTVRTGEIGIDLPVLAFTIAVAVGVAMLLAWAPSLPGVRGLGNLTSTAATRGAVGLPRKQLQRGLVVSQLALSFTLLIGAALLVRSLVNLTRVDVGIDYENVVAMEAPNFTGLGGEENRALMEDIVASTRMYPGVQRVAYSDRMPFDPNGMVMAIDFLVEGRDPEGEQSPMAVVSSVSTGYFETVGLSVLLGRGFDGTDRAEGEPVVVISKGMADAFFPGESPIDQRIARRLFNGEWGDMHRIVGVVEDSKEFGVNRVGNVHVAYRPADQSFAGNTVLVRTTGASGPLAQHVAEVVARHDADRPVDNIHTLEDLRADDIAPQRLNATLFSAFALLALLIAAVGVLGVLAFTVSQRTQEFGVRMALGARQGQVLGMVLREGVLMALAALVAGCAAAVFLSRFLAGLLYEVEATDPSTYLLVGTVLGAVAILAAYVPARRATRVDPMQALRSE